MSIADDIQVSKLELRGNQLSPVKVYSSFPIDRRSGLTLLFLESQTSIQFASETIQELIFKEMNISNIRHFSYADISSKIFKADYLLPQFDTFYTLVKISGDELRYPETMMELDNGISLHFDFNLSTIKANSYDLLIGFVSFIFDAYNYKREECVQLIFNNTGRIIRLFKINGKIKCIIKMGI
jgi:hypothetical protein